MNLTLNNIKNDYSTKVSNIILIHKNIQELMFQNKDKISKGINWKNVVLGRKENMGSPNAWDFST